jgi:hypothetical protein
MANIKNNNYRKIDCRLINDKYLDLMLSKDEINDIQNITECLAAQLNFFKHTNKQVISNIAWSDATPSNTILKNIGYTGVDNGFITYEKDRIGNDEFLNLYTNSTFDLSTYNDKFFVTEVKGNSGKFNYPLEVKDEYTALKGGFYQGFFKIDGDKYQTLPHHIKTEWNFNITLRRKDYLIPSNAINKYYTENAGIFFFIGTRAENKFWELYKAKSEMSDFKTNMKDDYSLDYSLDFGITDNCISDSYYIDEEYDSNCNEPFDEDYFQKPLQLNDLQLFDSKGNKIGEKGFYEIETDNKFIIFNHTKNGFNTKTWKDFYKFVLTGKKDGPNINYFPYLNHTKDGYTTKNIDKLNDEYSYTYDVLKDIKNNALAFKINDNGSISYRYYTSCDGLIEETSKEGLIPNNEWVNIHIKIMRKPNDICEKYYKPNKMQIYIYVNGFLKLVTKELPELMLKALDDTPERQEGVPYNISIGGGTQGLSERIMLDYYNISEYVLPLEKHFAGTFIGDIKEFTFSHCHMDFPAIYKKGNGFNSL